MSGLWKSILANFFLCWARGQSDGLRGRVIDSGIAIDPRLHVTAVVKQKKILRPLNTLSDLNQRNISRLYEKADFYGKGRRGLLVNSMPSFFETKLKKKLRAWNGNKIEI